MYSALDGVAVTTDPHGGEGLYAWSGMGWWKRPLTATGANILQNLLSVPSENLNANETAFFDNLDTLGQF